MGDLFGFRRVLDSTPFAVMAVAFAVLFVVCKSARQSFCPPVFIAPAEKNKIAAVVTYGKYLTTYVPFCQALFCADYQIL